MAPPLTWYPDAELRLKMQLVITTSPYSVDMTPPLCKHGAAHSARDSDARGRGSNAAAEAAAHGVIVEAGHHIAL